MSSPRTPKSTLIDSLLHHAAVRPDNIALCDISEREGRRELTWREFCNAAQSFSQTLVREYPGHTVMIALPNCAEAQIALLGSLWSGSRTFPLSPYLPKQGFRRLVEKLGKCVVIASPEQAEATGKIFDGIVVADNLTAESATRPLGPIEVWPDESRNASILLESSGTTGLPKIVRREMPSLVALGENLSMALSLTPSDRILVCIPLCHSYGIDVGMAAATVAGCGVELHGQFSPSAARESLEEGGITVWPAVPLMFDSVSRSDISVRPNRLRLAISAGSPLPSRIYEQFLRVFNVSIGQIYGATEFGSVFYGSPALTPFDPASVGRALEGVEARVLNVGMPDVEQSLANGVEGEIAIRTPTMLTDYLEGVAGLDSKGFLRTGDVGLVDDDGILRLTGRVKLLIDIGGKKVNPFEIESLLIKHPTVAEAVVLAVPYSDSAERVKALILAREGQCPDPIKLRAYLEVHLIGYKIPRTIEVRDTFPRSPTGKVLRSVLQAEAYEGMG